MIVEKVDRFMESKIRQWPVQSNRAGELGHPCVRYLTFLRTRGEERPLHDVGLQYIFEDGNLHEHAVLRLLEDAGLDPIEQQRPFQWKEHQISGRLDCKVTIGGEHIPVEIKSMNPYIWEKINSVEDMFHAKSVYLQKYPGQLTCYCLMDCKESALFLLKNKVNGRLKEIPLTLDYAYGETLVKRAEEVNSAMLERRVPEPIPWGDICESCAFRHICIVDVLRSEIEFVVDPDAEDKIDGWFELKDWMIKWKELDEWRREHFRGVDRVVVGPYLITGKATAKGWKTVITKI